MQGRCAFVAVGCTTPSEVAQEPEAPERPAAPKVVDVPPEPPAPKPVAVTPEPKPPKPVDPAPAAKEYNDALISNDTWTGRIIDKVKELGLGEKTHYYTTVDHGFDEV